MKGEDRETPETGDLIIDSKETRGEKSFTTTSRLHVQVCLSKNHIHYIYCHMSGQASTCLGETNSHKYQYFMLRNMYKWNKYLFGNKDSVAFCTVLCVLWDLGRRK